MRRIVPGRVDAWLLLATAVGLCGCPLLLEDHFSLAELSEPDAGGLCVDARCVPHSSDIGGRSGANGDGSGGSSPAVDAGSAGSSGATSSAGSGSATNDAGSGGASGTADAGGSSGQGGAESACWTLEQTSSGYTSASNCLGVHGSSHIVVDTGTTLELSFDSGDPCFTGTIAATGWGAVYEMSFAGEDDGAWDASSAGVTGLEFAYRGNEQPASLRVIYKDPSGVDNCHVIGAGTTSVPFSLAHPGCNTSGTTVDSARLDEMVLALVPQGAAYDVDFCIQMRALD